MRTTKQLSKALAKIEEEATERIKSFFKGKPYVRIIIEPRQYLKVDTGIQILHVEEIITKEEVGVVGMIGKQRVIFTASELPADALLTILDELERMKKGNQLKKP